jgi:uncharacterized protein (TIGR02996 family)
MYDERTFIEEIRANPGDDDRRLVYADFLEDDGDPRGELIRVQIELERLPLAAPERVTLMRREDALLAANGERWIEPLRRLGAQGLSIRCFHRGLIERVRLTAREFCANAQALCDVAPALGCVELREPQAAVEQLVRMTWPKQITGLDLSATNVTADLLRRLSDAPLTKFLHALNLQFNQSGDTGAEALVWWNSPYLEEAKLGMNSIGPGGMEHLRRWQPLWNLQSLALNLNPLGDAGIAQLAVATGRDRRWQQLDLASCRLTSRAIDNLLKVVGGTLQTLNLRANAIDQEGWQRLSDVLGPTLLHLDTRNNKDAMTAEVAGRFTNATVLR